MDDNRKALSEYRLSEADRCIKAAELSFASEDFKTAANRSYYAMFHCVRAIFALERIDYKKHSAVIGVFRKEYVKTGLFEKKYSDYLGEAFDVRGKSDYDDFYVISKMDVSQQIENARQFFKAVSLYINEYSGGLETK